MSRYLRGRLERIRESIRAPESPERSEARERIAAHLEGIAEARRNGTWTEEDAARQREVVRAEAARRRGRVIPIG